MRRVCLGLLLAGALGCGSNPQSRVIGTWHVDPATITVSRLQPGADKRTDWTDATVTMGKLQVTFVGRPNSVAAVGLDQTSTGSWTLSGDVISVKVKGETWPKMTIDPRTSTIHVSMTKNGEQLHLDLVKNQ